MLSTTLDPARFRQITGRYDGLTIAVLGDFYLDRYLEIDSSRAATSIETGLAVHNVTRVRAQPARARRGGRDRRRPTVASHPG